MTSVEKIQNEIVEELSLFTDWIEKYEYLIELGKDEIDFDKKFMKDEFLINGCQFLKQTIHHNSQKTKLEKLIK